MFPRNSGATNTRTRFDHRFGASINQRNALEPRTTPVRDERTRTGGHSPPGSYSAIRPKDPKELYSGGDDICTYLGQFNTLARAVRKGKESSRSPYRLIPDRGTDRPEFSRKSSGIVLNDHRRTSSSSRTLPEACRSQVRD